MGRWACAQGRFAGRWQRSRAAGRLGREEVQPLCCSPVKDSGELDHGLVGATVGAEAGGGGGGRGGGGK